MSKNLALVLAALCAGVITAFQSSGPEIGRPARPAEIRARDIDVAPDGRGLPAGRGDAREGRRVFLLYCVSCHGAKGQGNAGYPRLVGGLETLADSAPVLTVGSYWPYATTLWSYIRRAMPYTAPGSLTPDQVYSVTAYILYLNGVITQQERLDSRTLPLVKMPNRNGFILDSADFGSVP